MKVRNNFLKKVMKFGSLDTQNYRYRVKNVTELEYQFAIIERIPLDDLCSTAALSWQLVACTLDGEYFFHA